MEPLLSHCKQYLSADQHGFISQRSTTTNLLCLTSYITGSMDHRAQTDVLYTDLSAAFDKINHDIAIAKLHRLGVSDNLLRWFRSYLTNRQLVVAIGDCRSDSYLASSGIPQGSHLGPLIFLLYFNDVNLAIKCPRLSYADDLKMFSQIRSTDDCHFLQNQLEAFAAWCDVNRMPGGPFGSQSAPGAPSVSASDSDGPSEAEEYLDDIESGVVGATEEVRSEECEASDKPDQTLMKKPSDSELGWRYSAQPPALSQVGSHGIGGSCLDNAPHFPKNVPINRMLEEWYRFLGKFEIASSLSNINNPAQLAKHLFMCMGDELQDIVSIAKLRPGLNNPQCYQVMIDNIGAHLRKLTDPITEHQTYVKMTQGKDETIISFLTRLKSNVRSWQYSEQDEDRFMCTQLITGMRDRKLAEDARLYGYEIDVVVKAAARKEAFTMGNIDHENMEKVVEVSKPIVVAEFLVVADGRRSLLGRSTASKLRLLEAGLTVNYCENAKTCTTFPKIPGVVVKFSVDKSVPPERNAYYNVPAAFREAAKHRLEEMAAKGIIEKVTAAPLWISGMPAVAKGKNDFRLVVNMRGPNKAIKREFFRLPLLEEFFTKLDLCNAYYHLELSEESRDLTTFLAERGMYRFTRLMFGVNCAPEIFQREMCRLLENVRNKIVFIDDVLLFAETLEQLRLITEKVLHIFRDNLLTLNVAKCEFEKTRLQFLGHELDADGFHVDERKITDLQKFRQPATLSELRSFLGLASFISPHINNFIDIAAPLWAAASAKEWSWGREQESAFQRMKHHISHCTVSLGYFSNKHKTILYTDASPHALGAVLVQEDGSLTPRVISFASKALTATEKRYPQNQREALSAVWAVKHFWYFLLGRHFTLRTDARGIVFILNRLRETSKRALNRADGWALRLSPYNYDVEYVRGRENIADPSSRLYVGTDEPFNEEQSPWEIATLQANAVGFLTEQDIREATAHDNEL
ncbi:uncharacterized protein LOC128735975 [Sabethes cyaneus]|uniref:uncharacterized protein LOC128735975 n=1 Tax=Sabethes cyaneus TaxID=53552 RepID=UPI00237D98FC|nr:uncharacterized protein LOC128735975 [Sabethes cyaneus]